MLIFTLNEIFQIMKCQMKMSVNYQKLFTISIFFNLASHLGLILSQWISIFNIPLLAFLV